MLQNRLIEAESAFQTALKFHKIANAFLEQGRDYESLEDLYLRLNKLEDAIAACEKALELYESVNYTLGQANVHKTFTVGTYIYLKTG